MITLDMIAARLAECELFAESYMGRVPSDWISVVESTDLPSAVDVMDAVVRLKNESGAETDRQEIDDAIVSLIHLPGAYEGVAIVVRTKDHLVRVGLALA